MAVGLFGRQPKKPLSYYPISDLSRFYCQFHRTAHSSPWTVRCHGHQTKQNGRCDVIWRCENLLLVLLLSRPSGSIFILSTQIYACVFYDKRAFVLQKTQLAIGFAQMLNQDLSPNENNSFTKITVISVEKKKTVKIYVKGILLGKRRVVGGNDLVLAIETFSDTNDSYRYNHQWIEQITTKTRLCLCSMSKRHAKIFGAKKFKYNFIFDYLLYIFWRAFDVSRDLKKKTHIGAVCNVIP